MKKIRTQIGLLAALIVITSVWPMQAAQQNQTTTNSLADRATVDKTIAGWPERPRLGAQMMLSQYGAPHEATAEKLVWRDQGPYQCITVTKKEHHHDFPKPHMDFMEHTIAYRVPADKADALAEYDGSCTFDRTRGTLSARCDLEGHNILTLNLANDIVTGKKSASAARKAFGEIVSEDMMGKQPAYIKALQFQSPVMAEFADQPTIPGSPVRPSALGAKIEGSPGDGEILGFISAINENEIVAAMVASKKKVNAQVAGYAKMLHQEHGKNLDQTLKLGQKINVTPLETPAVDALRVKGAGELAGLVTKYGEDFATGYVATMIKGHTEALELIDQQLIPKASAEALKKHLTETRQHVAMHLEAAKRIQGEMAGRKADPTRIPVRERADEGK